MMKPTDLKPFVTHQDRWVRDAVVSYFSDAWSSDADLLPLVLKACEAYGADENSYVLARSSQFALRSDSLSGVLALLADTRNENVAFHLNKIVSKAPVPLLLTRESDILDTPHVTGDTVKRLDRRRMLAGEEGEQLWRDLQDLSDKSRDTKYVGQIDHAYADDLVEALAAHEAPDMDTICALLTSEIVEGEWLETFLVDLAGARKAREAVPVLVDKLRIDADYLLDRTVTALSRIGDRQAVDLIRQAFPVESWVFRLYTSSLLGYIKTPASEEAILALLETEASTDIRTDLCFSLCRLFSERGVPTVLREIEAGYDHNAVSLEEELLVVADVLGLSFPNAEKWRAEREETRRSQEQRRAELDQMAKGYVAQKKARAEHPHGRDDGWWPYEEVQPIRHTKEKVGRNEPCPCGSGKKYKKCCGRSKNR